MGKISSGDQMEQYEKLMRIYANSIGMDYSKKMNVMLSYHNHTVHSSYRMGIMDGVDYALSLIKLVGEECSVGKLIELQQETINVDKKAHSFYEQLREMVKDAQNITENDERIGK